MAQHDQQLIDRRSGGTCPGEQTRHAGPTPAAELAAELAARRTLKAQIARLEGELSEIVAARFPFIPAPAPVLAPGSGPRLLDLGGLEHARDRLAGQVQELRRLAADRAEHERRAREQLERVKLEPGRYKFFRLPVSDLGQGGCGVWEVRPRRGIIGMLAGWWQLTLSSGCPLPRGPRSRRGSARRRRASPRAFAAGARS